MGIVGKQKKKTVKKDRKTWGEVCQQQGLVEATDWFRRNKYEIGQDADGDTIYKKASVSEEIKLAKTKGGGYRKASHADPAHAVIVRNLHFIGRALVADHLAARTAVMPASKHREPSRAYLAHRDPAVRDPDWCRCSNNRWLFGAISSCV